MILPVNSVFIPLLNEIHRSMERERGNRRWRESERERHDKEKRKLPLPSPSFSPPFLPTVCAPLGHTIANENTAWDKQLLSDWSKWNRLFYSILHPWSIPYSIYPATSPLQFHRRKKKKVLYANQMLYSWLDYRRNNCLGWFMVVIGCHKLLQQKLSCHGLCYEDITSTQFRASPIKSTSAGTYKLHLKN